MNINHTKMTLEINSCKNYEILEVRQGDKGSRIIDFAFTVNGETVDLASTMSAKVNATVDDVIVADSVAAVVDTENNVVTVTLTDTMLALSGICKMDIVLTENDEIITAETVCLRVGKSVINDDSKAFPGASSIAEITKEVENARGSSNSLGARLDTVDTNLMKKANKSDVDSINSRLQSAETTLKNKANTTDVSNSLAKKADKSTTLAGYGITDAYTREKTNEKLARKLDSMPFDSEPTNNSPCYLTSGTVYSALTKKFDSSNIETGKGKLTPAEGCEGYEGSFNYSKIGKTVTVALNIIALADGYSVHFTGLPFPVMTASKMSSIAVYTPTGTPVNIRIGGTWLDVSSKDGTFADGEKINAIITYIIG